VSGALDVVVAVAIAVLAVAVVGIRSLFASIVLFMSLGLVMALGWLRLGAPDVALAEAALGAGVTGAMLLISARRLAGRPGGGAR
jgi:uncharacterized MnhB-related membrane protein